MTHIKFTQHRRAWYVVSGMLVLASIVLLSTAGLRYGLDFTGGSLLEVSYSLKRPDNDAVETILREHALSSSRIQPIGEEDILIRLPEISEDQHQKLLARLREHASGITSGNELSEKRYESFGPTLGAELKRNAFTAIIGVLVGIILYLAYAFRKVSRPVASWKFGAVAVIALAHDALILMGLFSFLGLIYGTEIDSLFVTALLTLLGFSVHDTIVTLDRIRENLFIKQDMTFAELVNTSINETIARSINTSMTTILTLVAIYVFGGSTIRDFTLALIIGIIVGTYSSIFIAAPLLVTWYTWGARKRA